MLQNTFRKIADDAGDFLREWNNQELWEDEDRLVLQDDKENLLEKHEDQLIFKNSFSPFLASICEAAGTTAHPLNG